MKPLISIAMATYNGEIFLREQLDSIYKQSYKNIELIVVDDCSSDNTVAILEEYKQRYGLFYVVNELNLGVTRNFEKSISMCTGEYIALVDQDDIWLPKKLEVLYENIGCSSLIYSNAGIINEKSKIQNKTTAEIYPLYGFDSTKEDVFNYITLLSILLGSATMFKRELLKDLLPIYQSHRNHDWWLQVCAYNKNGIKYIDDILFYYRHHNANYSRKKGGTVFQKTLNFYSKKSRQNRTAKLEEQYKITRFLFENNLYLSDDDEIFLLNIMQVCTSRLQTKVHFRAFYISIKYWKYMFFNKSDFINVLNLFGRLVS